MEFDSCIQELKQYMDIEGEDELTTHYNGMEIDQRREYIAILMTTYIDKLVDKHGWSSMKFSKTKPSAPLTEAMAKAIMEAGRGPLLKSPEGRKIEDEKGFQYRVLLGELIFVMVVTRLDIAYALSLLSRYAEYPMPIHYDGLRQVTKYLRETRDKPLIYWRRKPMYDLPPGDFVPYEIPDDLDFNFPEDPYLSSAEVDSSHANDLETRRSTGGHILYLFCTAVLWLAKLQTTCAMSSTEAEFMQAVSCAKCVKYGRSILNGIGRDQNGPSPIKEDNMAAIMIVNQKRPTKRTRHIDTQWFAIQDWKERGDIVMQHIGTGSNSADGLTKALGRVLHGRHANKAMGLYGSPHSFGKYKIPREND